VYLNSASIATEFIQTGFGRSGPPPVPYHVSHGKTILSEYCSKGNNGITEEYRVTEEGNIFIMNL